jgi:hypothetical protein
VNCKRSYAAAHSGHKALLMRKVSHTCHPTCVHQQQGSTHKDECSCCQAEQGTSHSSTTGPGDYGSLRLRQEVGLRLMAAVQHHRRGGLRSSLQPGALFSHHANSVVVCLTCSTVGATIAEVLGWHFEDADAYHPPTNVGERRMHQS